MLEKIKISVILTTYQSAGRLQNTLDSIRNQTGIDRDFTVELIVVDDCSKDATQDILRANGIQFHTTPKNSGGPNRGRNIGLEHVTGDFICLMDHDDVWEPDKLLCQLKVARFYPIVSTGYKVIDEVSGFRATYCADGEDIRVYSKNQTFLQRLIKSREGHRAYLSTLMYSSALRNVRFEEHFGVVDYDWYLRLFENQSSAEICRPLMTRYIHGSNLSLNTDYRRKDYYYTLLCLEDYEKRYPKEVSLARKRLNGSRARYYYLNGEMHSARAFLKKSIWDARTLLYFFTSYYGDHLIRKYFRVFG